MGSPNFSGLWCGVGQALGYVPQYPRSEDVAYAREAYGDELAQMTDEAVEAWLFDNEQAHCAEMYSWIKDVMESRYYNITQELWQFLDWDQKFPYELEFQLGYHGGWRVILASRHCCHHEQDETEWLSWCDLVQRRYAYPADWESPEPATWSVGVPHVPYENYCKHVQKVVDALVWAMENVAIANGLQLVLGGWTGGARPFRFDDRTPIVYREKWEQMFPVFCLKFAV